MITSKWHIVKCTRSSLLGRFLPALFTLDYQGAFLLLRCLFPLRRERYVDCVRSRHGYQAFDNSHTDEVCEGDASCDGHLGPNPTLQYNVHACF